MVKGLTTPTNNKTATVLNITNNNSVNNNTNTSNNTIRNNTNNFGRVLQAKLDPSESIIMAVDPLERSFSNMHETVPPSQLGTFFTIRLFMWI